MMQKSSSKSLKKLVLAAICLALCMVLPFITANIPTIGQALCPMHIPVLLCGFLAGPWYAAAVGFIAPLLRFVLFGFPPVYPNGLSMCFELLTYGLVTGLMYRLLPKKPAFLWVALIAAMLAGRAVWGCARLVMAGLAGTAFPWSAFIAGAFTGSIPGIIIHILLIPSLVLALKKAKIME